MGCTVIFVIANTYSSPENEVFFPLLNNQSDNQIRTDLQQPNYTDNQLQLRQPKAKHSKEPSQTNPSDNIHPALQGTSKKYTSTMSVELYLGLIFI